MFKNLNCLIDLINSAKLAQVSNLYFRINMFDFNENFVTNF